MLVDNGAPKEAKEEDGGTPLHLACMAGQADVVRMLVDRGADREAREEDGFTPLMYAAGNSHLECVRLLLNGGALVTAKNSVRPPFAYPFAPPFVKLTARCSAARRRWTWRPRTPSSSSSARRRWTR